jgi:oligopeptide/dipeptide ABC transporter ATP-binding protein
MSDFAEMAAGAGYIDEILAIVDETVERAERNQELWAFPEVLRVKGQLLLWRREPDPVLAEEYFVRSLDRARAQGAPAWELKARDVLRKRAHPYTEGLLAANLHGVEPGSRLMTIPGAPPNLAALPPGCSFAPRCAYALPQCGEATAMSRAAGAPRSGSRLRLEDTPVFLASLP